MVAIWKQSNLENRFSPFRDFVKQADADLKTLPEENRKPSRAVLYEALVQTDAQVGDAIPPVRLFLGQRGRLTDTVGPHCF